MAFKNTLVFLAILVSASVALAEKRPCATTEIFCYSAEISNRFKIYFTINNTLKDEATTLKYIKDLLQEIPSVKCIVKGCDKEFNHLFKKNLADNAKIHISGKEPFPVDAAGDITKTSEFQNKDTILKNNVDSPNQWKEHDSFFFDETNSDDKVNGSEIESISRKIDEYVEGLHNDDDDDLDEDDWNLSEADKQSVVKAQNISSYPLKFTLFPGGSANTTHRMKRARKPCDFGNLKHSSVKCEVWPDLLLCKQRCAYGHGLESSRGTTVKRKHKCRISENLWRPYRLQDCKPYMSCDVHLKEGHAGFIRCSQSHYLKPPTCKIKCGSKKVKHECSPHLSRRLPGCVTIAKSGELISPPRRLK